MPDFRAVILYIRGHSGVRVMKANRRNAKPRMTGALSVRKSYGTPPTYEVAFSLSTRAVMIWSAGDRLFSCDTSTLGRRLQHGCGTDKPCNIYTIL
jgi:hypothetical protein